MQRRRKTTKEERVCSICSQAFSKVEHLDRHVRSHTKEKPYRCQVCHKKFVRQYVLFPIILLHSNRHVNLIIPAKSDTLLRHSRSHEAKGAITEGSEAPPSDDRDEQCHDLDMSFGDATSGSTEAAPLGHMPLGLASHQQQCSIVAGPQDSLMSGALTPRASPTLNNSYDSTTCRDEIAPDLSGEPFLPIQDLDQQYGWLPQWDTDIGLDTQWLIDFTGERLDANGLSGSVPLDFSFPNQARQMPSPTPHPQTQLEGSSGLEHSSEGDTDIRRKWHSYIEIDTTGYIPPDLSQDRYQVDETCHQSLADRLRPRMREEPIPSTKFLVSAMAIAFKQNQS